jgi:hypothetical protein
MLNYIIYVLMQRHQRINQNGYRFYIGMCLQKVRDLTLTINGHQNSYEIRTRLA